MTTLQARALLQPWGYADDGSSDNVEVRPQLGTTVGLSLKHLRDGIDLNPVWLASVSRRDANNEIIGTEQWSFGEMLRLTAYLRESVLLGVGIASVERVFRTNVTLCIQRLCTSAEAARGMKSWQGTAHRDLAGQPIEILEEIGCAGAPSTKPCVNPHRMVILASRPDLWVPQDCGLCESCAARRVLTR